MADHFSSSTFLNRKTPNVLEAVFMFVGFFFFN